MNRFSGILYFFRKERNGALLLFVLSAVLVVIPNLISGFKSSESYKFNGDSAVMADLLEKEKAFLDSLRQSKYTINPIRYGLTVHDLEKLGFSESVAQKIAFALRKKGKTTTIGELAKETGMDSSKLALIFVASAETNPENQNFSVVEINTADSLSLVRLPGIGPKTAHRILQYKNVLGGFYATRQLYEIRFIDSHALEQLTNRIICEPGKVRILDIANLSADALSKHPYISKSQARVLKAYANQHGFLTTSDLEKIPVFSNFERERLIPYLPKFNNN